MPQAVFLYPLVIREAHLDTFGHVNNATYLELFEEARWEFITHNGYDIQKIKETGLGPTILEVTISFLKEIKLREQVMVESQMLFYKNKIGKLQQKILRDGIVCCEAEFTMGLFDLKNRKLVLPTPDWLQALGMEV